MNWTAEQQQIIEARGTDLLVSAAAGSGKTAVLVERIIQMLTDPDEPVPVDRLVIMTFTRAAAEEMRERIAAALRGRIEQEPDNRYLQLQKAMLPRARIATIDSICQNLIKQNYALLELDPGFRVADEGELRMLAGDAMNQILEQNYEASEEDFSRFAEVYAGRSDERLRGLIEMLYRFIQANPWPLSYLDGQKEEAEAEQRGELSGLRWVQYLFDDVQGRAQEYVQLLETARELCDAPGGPAPYLNGVEERLDAAQRLSEISDYDALYDFVSKLGFSNLKAVRGEKYDPELKEQVKAVCDHFRDYVKNLKTGYAALPPGELRAAVRGTAPYVQVLLRLTEEYLKRFEEIRREKNVVDFTDMEHLALQLLYEEQDGVRRPSALADTLSQNFAEILIDEYQDSNSLQEALIRALSAERFGRPDVFMVGDVKQSIYRFRLARPEIFMQKYDSYLPLFASGEANGKMTATGTTKGKAAGAAAAGALAGKSDSAATDPEKHCKIELNRNFRSRGEVLRSINCLFFRLMQKHVGGVEYTEETALHQGAAFAEPETEQDYRTELLLLDLSQEQEGGGAESDAETPEKAELEAQMIADRILELVRPVAGKQPFLVTDKATGGFRPATFRDIVILLRAPGSSAEKLVDKLAACDIPAYTENASGYFNAVEVETMLAYLSIIDNPHQDIPLAAVLRSPAGGFSDAELAELRAAFDRGREAAQFEGSMGNGTGNAGTAIDEEDAISKAEAAAEVGNEMPEKVQLPETGDSLSGAYACTDLYAALKAATAAEPEVHSVISVTPQLAKKAAQFLVRLQQYREEADFMPVHRLLAKIYRETGYYAYASAMPMGKQRRKNLDMLLQRAQSFAETSYSGIFNFVRYIEQIRKYDTDYGEASAVSEQDDLVRITSIHKSKGLEYPIVILAGLHRQFNRQDLREALLIDADLGIGSDYVDLEARVRYPGLKKEVIKQKQLAENDGEELRVLYVAMTRAKEKLIMTAAVNDAEKKLQKMRSLGALCTADGKLPKGVLLSAGSLLDFVLLGMPETQTDIELMIRKPSDLENAKQEREAEGTEKLRQLLSLSPKEIADPVFAAKLADDLNAVYPDPEDTRLAPKKTVSEIKEQFLQKDMCEERSSETGPSEYAAAAEHVLSEEAMKTAAVTVKEVAAEEKMYEQGETPILPVPMDLDFDDLAGEEAAFAEACTEACAPLADAYEKLRKREEEKGGAKRGNAYHRVLQLLDLALAAEKGAREAIAALCRKRLISEEEEKLADAADIEQFVKSSLGARMAEAQKKGKLFREQRFMIGLPASKLSQDTSSETLQLLQGIIDAYFENEDGSLTLVDYKTDRLFGLSEEEAEAELRERYRVQLALYRRALEQLLEKPVAETYLYSTFLGKAIRLKNETA